MASKEFSKSFKKHFQAQADYEEQIWEMEYMEELDSDLAETLSTAMAKVEWKHGPQPRWSFPTLVPGYDDYSPIEFNTTSSSPDYLLAISFNEIELCPRLIGFDQYDKMAGLFGSWHVDLEDELKGSTEFQWGVDLGECVQLGLAAINADRKAGFDKYKIPKSMQSLACGPEVVLYFYGLLSKALGYAFYEHGQISFLENHMGFYEDCQDLWNWFTKETAKQGS